MKTTNTNNYRIEGEDLASWISISDLMSGLLIIFILTLSLYMLIFSQKTAELTNNNKIRKEIIHEIVKKIRQEGFDVRVDDNNRVIRLREGLLFRSGHAELEEDGKKLLTVLGYILFDVLNRNKYKGKVETVFIEGHTDAVRIGSKIKAKYESNWELSAQRAINTWKFLKKQVVQLDTLKNSKGQQLFSVSGYGASRLLKGLPDNSSKHRRIDIRISMTPPTLPGKDTNEVMQDIKKGINKL